MDDLLDIYGQECPVAKELGIEMQSTWWADFTVAERISGEVGVRDTFRRAYKYWMNDRVLTTELVLVLNWKAWEHHDKGNQKLSSVYVELWQKADRYVMENWKGDDLAYFLERTD